MTTTTSTTSRAAVAGAPRALRAVIPAVLVAVLGAGCGVSASSFTLPGGAEVGDDPRTVSIRFDEVLDLVPQASVKVNGMPAGRVSSVALAPDGWTAQVEVELSEHVDLPANAEASIQQTNLLGERFIQLNAPSDVPPVGHLEDGDVIDLDATRTATDIEQVLGALSLLLNGGGVDRIQPIVAELNALTGGRESELRASLESAEQLIGSLNRQRDSIVAALDGVNELSGRARGQQEQIRAVLDELLAGVAVLDEQRPEFIRMLEEIDAAGQVGSDILLRSRSDLIADLRALRPVLQNLAQVTPDFIDVAGIVPTFPFPDASIDSTIGGAANVFLSIDGQIADLLKNLGVNQGDPVYPEVKSTSGPYNLDPRNPWLGGNGPDRRTTIVLPLLPVPPVMDRAVVPAPAPGVSPLEHYLQPGPEGTP